MLLLRRPVVRPSPPRVLACARPNPTSCLATGIRLVWVRPYGRTRAGSVSRDSAGNSCRHVGRERRETARSEILRRRSFGSRDGTHDGRSPTMARVRASQPGGRLVPCRHSRPPVPAGGRRRRISGGPPRESGGDHHAPDMSPSILSDISAGKSIPGLLGLRSRRMGTRRTWSTRSCRFRRGLARRRTRRSDPADGAPQFFAAGRQEGSPAIIGWPGAAHCPPGAGTAAAPCPPAGPRRASAAT